MRRAQFEILGLAVILVVVSVVVFFAIALTLQPDENLPAQYFDKQFAENTLDALLATSLRGCQGTVAEYFTSVVAQRPLRPLQSGTSPACADLEEGVDQIMENLQKGISEYSGKTFVFQVREQACLPSGEDCVFAISYDGGCNLAVSDTRNAARRQLSMYPRPEPAEVVLWVCEPQ